jgi:uncharacterized protein
MKKILSKLLFYCLLFLSVAMGVNAAALPEGIPDSQGALVFDEAGLLTAGEAAQLTTKLETLNQKYGITLVIVTASGTGARSNTAYADDYYDYNGYQANGAVLLINMEPQGWYISTAGSVIQSFTDYGIEKIGEMIRPDLSNGDYYAAFIEFVGLADTFLTQAKEGEPYDTNHRFVTSANRYEMILTMVLVAFLIALLVVRILAMGMKTVRQQSGAYEYEKGLNLTDRRDIFLFSNVVRQKIESNKGGGSSTHSGSSGRSHGGGGGGF